MFKDILNADQMRLLPLIKAFSSDYYLVGGTAIALNIGHRRSIDFDLFTDKPIKRIRNKRIIDENGFSISRVIYEDKDQMHSLPRICFGVIVEDVKMTFFNFPFSIKATIDFENIIKMPTLLDLSAMKAFALGGRAKWKDYVDLYFLLRDNFSLEQVSKNAKSVFGKSFNEKLFREQLPYFVDIDYTESVEYMPGKQVSDADIQKYLKEVSV